MSNKPEEVTDKEWEIYIKVARIVGGQSGKPTRKDPDYYSKIAKKRWKKVHQEEV